MNENKHLACRSAMECIHVMMAFNKQEYFKKTTSIEYCRKYKHFACRSAKECIHVMMVINIKK